MHEFVGRGGDCHDKQTSTNSVAALVRYHVTDLITKTRTKGYGEALFWCHWYRRNFSPFTFFLSFFFFPFWEGKGGRRGLSFTTQWNVLPFANVQVRDLLSNCFKTLKIYLSLMLKREFLLCRTWCNVIILLRQIWTCLRRCWVTVLSGEIAGC